MIKYIKHLLTRNKPPEIGQVWKYGHSCKWKMKIVGVSHFQVITVEENGIVGDYSFSWWERYKRIHNMYLIRTEKI